jgi:hypothetical protein
MNGAPLASRGIAPTSLLFEKDVAQTQLLHRHTPLAKSCFSQPFIAMATIRDNIAPARHIRAT